MRPENLSNRIPKFGLGARAGARIGPPSATGRQTLQPILTRRRLQLYTGSGTANAAADGRRATAAALAGHEGP